MPHSIIRLILVEDSADLREDLSYQLASQGIQVTALANASACYRHLRQAPCDIAVLDIGLPGEDGLSLAGRLRERYPELGIIMLTARGELDTRLQGYGAGADLYLVKPVDWRELLAAVKALYRRLHPLAGNEEADTWSLRKGGRELVTPSGASIILTTLEAQIIRYLATKPGQDVHRLALINHLTDNAPHRFDPHRIEVCVSRLRQKMLSAMPQDTTTNIGKKDLPLVTVRGVGYSFVAPIDLQSP